MLDLKGFAEICSTWMVVPDRLPLWGFFYPFIELFFGIACAVVFHLLIINSLVLVVMAVTIAGVLKSVLNKTKISCA